MLFTGARPSELGQLAVADIKLSGQTPYISILTEYDPDDPEDRTFYLTCKTANARREVPLHPKLVELGFDRYVLRMQERGHARLFSEWKAPSDPRKLYSSASWIRRFNEKIIRSCSQRHPKPTFYSLRHTFKVAMVRQGKVMLDRRRLIDEVKARLPSKNHRPHANVGRIGLVFNLLEPTLDEVAGDLPLFGNLEVGPRAFGNEAVVSRVFQVGEALFDQATSLILGHGVDGQHVKRLEYARAIFQREPTCRSRVDV
jgi:hypothetical protein